MWLGLELSQIRVGLEPDYVVKIRAGSDYGLGLGQIIGLGLGRLVQKIIDMFAHFLT